MAFSFSLFVIVWLRSRRASRSESLAGYRALMARKTSSVVGAPEESDAPAPMRSVSASLSRTACTSRSASRHCLDPAGIGIALNETAPQRGVLKSTVAAGTLHSPGSLTRGRLPTAGLGWRRPDGPSRPS
jgi:hypothetical protein